MQLLGSLTSSLVLPFLLQWSRIKTLSLASFLFIVTNIIIIFSSNNWVFRLSEFLTGLSTGISLPAIHLFSSEVFTDKRRIRFASLISLIELIGECSGICLLYFFTSDACSWLTIVLCILCLVSTSSFAPETPRLLLMKNDKSSCVDSLQWLRGHLSDLAGEFSTLSSRLEKSLGSQSLIKSLQQRCIYTPILISIILMLLSSLYPSQIFQLLFITNFSGSTLNMNLIMVDVGVRMVGGVLSIFLCRKLGMKVILLIGKI